MNLELNSFQEESKDTDSKEYMEWVYTLMETYDKLPYPDPEVF